MYKESLNTSVDAYSIGKTQKLNFSLKADLGPAILPKVKKDTDLSLVAGQCSPYLIMMFGDSRLWSEATKFFKSDNIDLLVNNAGVMGEREGWKLCIDINLVGSNLSPRVPQRKPIGFFCWSVPVFVVDSEAEWPKRN